VVEKLLSRRQKKSKYEYEVQWKGLSMDQSSWMPRESLEKFGFLKYMNRVDEREAARAGLYARPLTQANVEKHLIDFGLEAEFGTHNRIKGLSGGQKVKLVLGSAMWQGAAPGSTLTPPHVYTLATSSSLSAAARSRTFRSWCTCTH
jgi:elongation factor 3